MANEDGLDAREAAAIAAATRYGVGRPGQQGAGVGQGSAVGAGKGMAQRSEGNKFLTILVVIVVLVGTLAMMIALGR
ncbi:MAG: hypothetical protein RLZ98_1697 [Pseudomonadota bacterium]|jgi:F0F1-type ATP synthase membrane subunit c/vacuolar-type H+-ATPase subunit K